MNSVALQNSNLTSSHSQRNHTFSRMVSGNTSINRTTDASLEHEDETLQKRMSVVNLEAAIGVRNSYQVDKVAELGLAYRFGKASGLRLSPSLLGHSSFALAGHYLR
jgi:hypothetical protein